MQHTADAIIHSRRWDEQTDVEFISAPEASIQACRGSFREKHEKKRKKITRDKVNRRPEAGKDSLNQRHIPGSSEPS